MRLVLFLLFPPLTPFNQGGYGGEGGGSEKAGILSLTPWSRLFFLFPGVAAFSLVGCYPL